MVWFIRVTVSIAASLSLVLVLLLRSCHGLPTIHQELGASQDSRLSPQSLDATQKDFLHEMIRANDKERWVVAATVSHSDLVRVEAVDAVDGHATTFPLPFSPGKIDEAQALQHHPANPSGAAQAPPTADGPVTAGADLLRELLPDLNLVAGDTDERYSSEGVFVQRPNLTVEEPAKEEEAPHASTEALLEVSGKVKSGGGPTVVIAAVAGLTGLMTLGLVTFYFLSYRSRSTEPGPKMKLIDDNVPHEKVSTRPEVSAVTGRQLVAPKRGQKFNEADVRMVREALQGGHKLETDDVDKVRQMMIAEVEATSLGPTGSTLGSRSSLVPLPPTEQRRDTLMERAAAYVSGNPALIVKIIEARGVMAKDECGTSDPFCEVTVGSAVYKTQVKFKTLSPKWDDAVFRFEWSAKVHDLQIVMWDDDSNEVDTSVPAHLRIPRHAGDTANADFLGKVEIKAKQLKDLFKEGSKKKQDIGMVDWPVTDAWYKLCKRSIRSHVSGELRIRLAWENV